jgi:hypothetical protein
MPVLGTAMPAMIPTITMTVRASTRLKPRRSKLLARLLELVIIMLPPVWLAIILGAAG